MRKTPMLHRVLLLVPFLLLGLLARPAHAGDDDQQEGCITCHSDKDMDPNVRKPALAFAKDAHHAAGLSCTACHGGKDGTLDYVDAHDEKAGFRSKFTATEVVALCSGCHDDAAKMASLGSKIEVTKPGEHFRRSVHAHVNPVKGFEEPSCISCHGPHGILPPSDPDSTVNPVHVPETCARCHGDLTYMRAFTSARIRVDQLIEYKTSIHGQRLAKGDTKVAVCSSCHGNHEILPASDPNSSVYPLNVAKTCGACHADPKHMSGYQIASRNGGMMPLPTNQLEHWQASVHHEALVEKGDLSAPTCNDCHGNHGATPPQVRAVENMCAQCHSRNGELFAKSPLKVDLDKEGWPGCVTCHSNHRVLHPSDALLAAISQGLTPSGWQPEAKWRSLATDLLGSIQKLQRKIDDSQRLVDEVANYGMDMTEARRRLHDATDRLVQARVMIHAWDRDHMKGLLEGTEDQEGGLALADQAEAIANAGLDERGFRRLGLVIALAIIALVIAALVVRIRRLDAETP
jgi:hypothetical protein